MNLKKILIKNFIAPHGITDLTHSIIYDNYDKLLKIQLATFTISELLTNAFHQKIILDFIFFTTTIIHFRKDFNTINIDIPNVLKSFIFVSTCLYIDKLFPYEFGIDMLLLFMSFIHVPNHYKNNYKYIKKEPVLNFLLLLAFTGCINSVDNLHPELLVSEQVLTITKSIIISHVVYSEKYITNP
jgi:hypothetical protein